MVLGLMLGLVLVTLMVVVVVVGVLRIPVSLISVVTCQPACMLSVMLDPVLVPCTETRRRRKLRRTRAGSIVRMPFVLQELRLVWMGGMGLCVLMRVALVVMVWWVEMGVNIKDRNERIVEKECG